MALKPLDLAWALTAPMPPLDFVLPGLLPGSFGLMIAPGATGKSTLALDVAVSMALGRPIAGGLFSGVPAGKAVMLAGEESERLLAERVRSLLNLSEQGLPALYDNLVLLPMAGNSSTLLCDGRPTIAYEELSALAQGARLIIVDPVRRLHGGDENNSAEMTKFVVAMESLAKATGAAVMGIHHANRASSADSASQNASRGSSALVDGARWQINLSRMDEKTAEAHKVAEAERALYVAVDFAKTNYLAPRPRCWLKRQPGGRLLLTTLEPRSTKVHAFGGVRTLNT